MGEGIERFDRIEAAGVRLEILSIGGLETTVHLPAWKVAFDVARCPAPIVNRDLVCFTHGHMDHMGGVAYHCATRALRGMPVPTYVLPPSYVDELEELLAVWRRIDRSEMPHVTVPLEEGDEYRLHAGLVVRPFRAYHTAPTQGYAVWSEREKLLPEHAGKDGEEIRRLRVEEGVSVTETVAVPELAYCGDTTIEVVERQEVVRRARVLVLESTFVDDRISVAETRERGHVHLDEIAERADLFENEAIVLHHFSARFRAEEILAALDARLPASLRERVIPVLNGHR